MNKRVDNINIPHRNRAHDLPTESWPLSVQVPISPRFLVYRTAGSEDYVLYCHAQEWGCTE